MVRRVMDKPSDNTVVSSQESAPADTSPTNQEMKKTAVVPPTEFVPKTASSLEVDLSLKQFGPYKIVKILGFGGMGTVYQADDTQINRQVALKVLKKKWIHDEIAKERFLREARLSSLIKSKHVATIHAVGEENGTPYLAMELLDGFPLERVIYDKTKLSTVQIARLGREIARGLAAAHEKGLIHRDIKPANIWLETVQDESGSDKKLFRVKILDFGMARLQEQTQGLTRHGVVVGTPLYMSPEQASSGKIDTRSDLFSLGVVLYELCTGRVPFKGETAMGVISALANETPVSVREINPDIPKKLSRLVDRLLSKSPDERPPNALNVARLLENIEREQGHASISEVQKPEPAVVETALHVAMNNGKLQTVQKWLIVSAVLNVVLLLAVAFLLGRFFT